MSAPVVVRTEQLSKRYGQTFALDGLDLEIEAGEVFGAFVFAFVATALFRHRDLQTV